MTNWYKTGPTAQRWRQLALAALLASGATLAQAQNLNYSPFGTQNLAGTYTDLGTTGTVITTPNTDDANSDAIPIGFTFTYNGTAFNDFVLNTNGFLKLGTTAPAAPYFSSGSQNPTGGPLNSTTESNLLLPFNDDLIDATAGPSEYRVAVTGTAPNRVCTIQWKNVKDKPRATAAGGTTILGTQLDNFSFQVKLYETTNVIDFVYGGAIAGAGPDALKLEVVGLKGSGANTGQVLVGTKTSAAAWSTTTFGNTVYTATGNAHNVRSTARPDAGRTYRFNSAAPNDVAVTNVYSLGKLAIPSGTPHTIQAIIRNVGSNPVTNASVTATVAGANTYTSTKTVASLAVGASATISFDPFTPTATGNETITVTSANDDVASNNTKTYEQVVNTTTLAVAEPNGPVSSSVGFTNNTTGDAGTGIFAVKYNVNTARSVTAVTARIEDVRSVGRTIYTVVCDNTGAIIGRTPDYVVLASDIATFKTFTLTTPAQVPAGSFFVGVAEGASPAGTAPFYPVGLQAEIPTRSGTFYTMAITGGSPADAASNNLGRFMIEAVTGVGITCLPPVASNIFIFPNATTAQIVYSGVTGGTAYSLIYGPTGFNPTTGGTTVSSTASPATLTGLTPATTYQVYIRTNCGTTDQSTLTGPLSFTTLCNPTAVTAFPYTENFDAARALPCGVSINNTNADTVSWKVRPTVPGQTGPLVVAASAPNAMVYYYNEDAATPGNDWFYTPPMLLRTGNRYQLSFKYRNSGTNYTEKLEVTYGTSASPAGQTTQLWKNEAIGTTTFLTADATSTIPVLPVVPTTTGNYYIGFHVYSDADKFFVAIDDLQVTATAITGTSAALDYAISVFPNPSAGVFSVDIKNANAKGAMQVEVMNSLGQIVHTALVRDNQLNKLDLSNLAGGMYILKVKSGNDFSVRNISIQK
ncbi:T9SS type A sorting domain-containing protein [Hymenobacter chitinivorans]|uniref:Putative secreted protein (Por secretion system target) n=1 Tax=Hymenobacter chitinivorans DSM 11115 TaxID=1121954 RepID=A0A2M9AQ34_9BACT|nr:T9SS type A sorting domain-containing protein [Hymenobacter chitinivorans]PJJ47817.1 putative secreted protein (Por secretion system target) [Hymenobacter chitinivorans DSM 11115]